MPRENGIYVPTAGVPFSNGTIADADVVNELVADIGDELSNSVPRDGSAPALANLPMGNFRHTGVGNASALTHYAAAGQVQNSAFTTAGNLAGTANAITADLTPPVLAYADGQRFTFKPLSSNTGPVTIALNGLAAIHVYKGTGSDPSITELVANDLIAGVPIDVICNGTAFILQNPQSATIGAIWANLILNNLPFSRSVAEIKAGVIPTIYAYDQNSVMRYGADPSNKAFDCLAAFNRAAAVAVYSGRIVIPAVPDAGYFYRLSDTWVLQNLDGVTIEGEGDRSCLLIANGTGVNAVTIDSSLHLVIRNIGISGVANSGNGVEFINSSHYCVLEDVWVGWVGAACIKNTEGVSIRIQQSGPDRNNGYRPADLTGTGLTEGTPTHGVLWKSHAAGLTNHPSFVGYHINACGSVCSLQIGDPYPALPVQSFSYTGGLVQGAGNRREFYFNTLDSTIDGTHFEPTPGVATEWLGTFDSCVNTIIKGGVLTGDVRMIGSCFASGIENATGCGVDIGTNCENVFVRDFTEGSIITGLAGGKIKDRGKNTDLWRIRNAGNARVSSGNFIRNPTVVYETGMGTWVSPGGTPSVPCGFTIFGAPTITQETGIVRSGPIAVRIVMSADNTQGITIPLEPKELFLGRPVTVECWVYNITTPGLARIALAEGGTGAVVYQVSSQAGQWERILCTFVPNASATSLALRITGPTGTIIAQDFKITVDNFTPIREQSLATVATPKVSVGGILVPRWIVTASATDITGVEEPHVGIPMDFIWTGNRTLKNNANIALKSGGDTVGTAGTTRRLTYGSDGVLREV